MKKSKLLTVLFCIVAAILLIGALHIFRLNHRDSLDWRLLKTRDSYTLDIQQMNGADSHTLNLTAKDVLQVEFETKKVIFTWKSQRRMARSFTLETVRKPQSLKSTFRKPACTQLPWRHGTLRELSILEHILNQ